MAKQYKSTAHYLSAADAYRSAGELFTEGKLEEGSRKTAEGNWHIRVGDLCFEEEHKRAILEIALKLIEDERQ